MKLKTQILLVVMVPLLMLGVVIYAIGSKEITEAMTQTIENGLEATAIAARDAITVGIEGELYVNENGELWKGETMNISASTDMVDDIRSATGMELTVFYGDTRYMTSVVDDTGKRVIGTQASEEVVQQVLVKGENYFAENVDVVGEAFFAYYVPLYNEGEDKPVGMVFTGMSQEDAKAQINAILNKLLVIILVMVVLFVVLAWFIARGIVKGIQSGVSVLEEIANGNLTVKIEERYLKNKSEIGEMVQAVAKLKRELLFLIGEIVGKSRQVYQEAQQLSEKAKNAAQMVEQMERATMEIAQGAGTQAEETQTATEHIVLMGDMVEKTNYEVGNLLDNSNQIRRAGEAAAAALKELNNINREVTDAVQTIFNQTNTTNESALKIREATNIITSIAEETNLLSLNASIEAARAGEQGRGFAVVAGQIQKLAEQSDESAKKIEVITDLLIHDSKEAVTTMNEMQEIMRQQNEKVSQTDQDFNGVKNGIAESITGIEKIAGQTGSLDQARSKVVDGVQSLSAIAQENAAATQETSASVAEVSHIVEGISQSAGELREIADELQKSVEMFKVEEKG